LAACLGLELDAVAGEVRFIAPVLPTDLERVTLRGLRLGTVGTADIVVERSETGIVVRTLARNGSIRVVTRAA
jgi:hypothetical protein